MTDNDIQIARMPDRKKKTHCIRLIEERESNLSDKMVEIKHQNII